MVRMLYIMLLLSGLGLPGVVAAQGVNVGMPIGSSCPVGYHWELAGGFAQCITDAPPVPPVPPITSYTFVYLVATFTDRCNGNGCHSTTSINRTTTSAGNQWAILYQASDNTVLPWGFDLGPLAGSNPISYDAQDLRSFMAPFINANCVLASDSAEVKSIISSAIGLSLNAYPGGPYAGQSMPNSNVGNPAAQNYALCQTAVM